MKNKILLLLFFFAISPPVAAFATEPLNIKEKQWIKEHPDVSYTVLDRWPQETTDKGIHVGLSREVLNEVEQRTGLKFHYVPPEQALLDPPMIISAVNGALLSSDEKKRWLLTFPWANTMPMIVGPKNGVRLRTLKQLEGQQIAVVADSDYVGWLRLHYPSIRLDIQPDIMSALKSVSERKNAAALASGLVMLPILQRHYTHELAIVAQVSEMASGINMAVDPHYPELRDIIDKSMENITANDAQKMFVRWIGIVDIGTPGLAFLAWQYRYPLFVIGLLLILLCIAWRNTFLARRRAEQSEKHKSDFLAVMSHEIRTPMNAIVASLDLLKRNHKVSNRTELVELAYSSSYDLLALLNSVLDHEKLDQNRITLTPAPADLNMLLSSVVESHRASADRKKIALIYQYQLPGTTGWIRVDAHRLRQIVNNLLSNAIKFTQQGQVHLSAGMDETGLVIRVNDSGPGIDHKLQEKLFQAWSQGSALPGGSGLGLYISRSLAQLMGGKLQLESTPGEGTCLTLILPPEWCEPAEIDKETSPPLPDYNFRCSVLVVEDHRINRELMAQQLTALRCHCDQAEDGERALRLLEEENYYDLILLDCGLPGIDGYEVARRIRQMEKGAAREATPIVAVSAQQSARHLRHCQESGMSGCLIKPVRLHDLVMALAKWCAGTKPEFTASLSVPRAAPDDDVLQSLAEDSESFHQAMKNRDVQRMIYHIHRIRGLAMMQEFDCLAAFAGKVEVSLREDGENKIKDNQWPAELQRMMAELKVSQL